MATRIYSLDEPQRPARGHNNFWYDDRQTDQVMVFVHGVLSDSAGCWYREPSENQAGVYWPDLLLKDKCFDSYSIFLGGYKTNHKSAQYEVSDCAEELFGALKRRKDLDGPPTVLERKTIVFVCHSMGGIVVRYMLTARPWEFEDKRIGLVLIASPSSGSPWANRLDLLLKYFKHTQGTELKWGNWNLEDLDGRFRIIMSAKKINLLGAEACENKFIFDASWLPPVEPVVSRNSAGAYFDRVRMLADTDHFTCVKPSDRDHPAYEFLLDFHNSFSSNNTDQLKPIAASLPQPPSSACSGSNRSSLCWDVKIDEEGDAYNELTYAGLVLPRKRPYVFSLPPAEVQSGHTTEFELIWDGRTTEGTCLGNTAVATPSKVEMKVEFSNPPTASNPASFAVRCWDWNVYSMNMEEYRQKASWREDGMDYAEKYIPEKWDNFTTLIQFPSQMVFAKRPFFEIYNPSSGTDQVRNDELTGGYQHCFHYSRSLHQAVLSIERPPAPFSYRISWLLGESRLSVASALIPAQRQRQRIFARKLLQMRRTLDGQTPDNLSDAKELEQGINSAIASVAEHVQQMIGSAELDPVGLEISLMVLDEDQPQLPSMGKKKLPVLRIVVGTLLEDEAYRSLAIFVGDGNAGRAWKRRMARVFDQNESDPKRHVYVPISPTRCHRFLVSIPLIDPESDAVVYGILNFGTFADDQAELLRKTGASQEVQNMTSYAQSYVLKRLMELLKL
jgi:hypothetical protein